MCPALSMYHLKNLRNKRSPPRFPGRAVCLKKTLPLRNRSVTGRKTSGSHHNGSAFKLFFGSFFSREKGTQSSPKLMPSRRASAMMSDLGSMVLSLPATSFRGTEVMT